MSHQKSLSSEVVSYISGDFGTSETVVSSQESEEVAEAVRKDVSIPDDEFFSSNEKCPSLKLPSNRVCWWSLIEISSQSIGKHREDEHCNTGHDSSSWFLVQEKQWNVADEPELEIHG